MKKKHFLLFACLVLAGIFLWKNFSNPKVSKEIIGEKQRMQKIINDRGPQQAYVLLKDEYANRPGLAHTVTHLFGQLIYEKVGMKAILICDNSFGYACYHGVYIAAIAQKGERILNELDSICNTGEANKDLNCPHGIGHGILEYKGHSKLIEALDTCDLLSNVKNRFGCENGVFMEYNFPALENNDGIKNVLRREYDAQKPLSPCDSIPQKYTKVCYFSISQYLRAVFNYDYLVIGKICSGIAESESRKACYIGIGNNLPFDDNNESGAIIASCEKMPTKEGISHCLMGASWASSSSQLSKELCNEFRRVTLSQCSSNFGQFLLEK